MKVNTLMKHFNDLTNKALETKLISDYTRLSEGRQLFIFEKTCEILNEDGAEMRARQREMRAKPREPEQFSQPVRPEPEQESLFGKAVGTLSDLIREIPRAAARGAVATAPDFEWVEKQMRSFGMFGPGQEKMGQTTREREEKVTQTTADIEKYQKELESKGIKGWEGIEVPSAEIEALQQYQAAEGPTRPGVPNIPTLQRKAQLKAYQEFKERTTGKTEAELKKMYGDDPSKFASDEQFMTNKMAVEMMPLTTIETRGSGIPRGIASGSAETLKNVGENLPTIAAIGAAAAAAPAAAAGVARLTTPLLPAAARVAPSTASELTRQALTTTFAGMGLKDIATATDPVQLGLGAAMAAPGAKTVARGVEAVSGAPATYPVGRIRQFNRELARVTRGQEEFIARAKSQESMAQRELKGGSVEGKKAAEQPEWSTDTGERGRLGQQEWKAMNSELLRRIWGKGEIFSPEVLRQAARQATKERIEAETPEVPSERISPRPDFATAAPTFDLARVPRPRIATIERDRFQSQPAAPVKISGKEAIAKGVGVIKGYGDIAARLAKNIEARLKAAVEGGSPSIGYEVAPRISPSVPKHLRTPAEKPAVGPVQRGVWNAQDFVKNMVKNIQRAKAELDPKVLAVNAAANLATLNTMVLPEPVGPRITARAVEPSVPSVRQEVAKIDTTVRPTAASQPKAPEKPVSGVSVEAPKQVKTPSNMGGMNTPVSLPEYEPSEGGMNVAVTLPEYDKEEPKVEKSTGGTPPTETLPEPSERIPLTLKTVKGLEIKAPETTSGARVAAPSTQPSLPELPKQVAVAPGSIPAAEVLPQTDGPEKIATKTFTKLTAELPSEIGQSRVVAKAEQPSVTTDKVAQVGKEQVPSADKAPVPSAEKAPVADLKPSTAATTAAVAATVLNTLTNTSTAGGATKFETIKDTSGPVNPLPKPKKGGGAGAGGPGIEVPEEETETTRTGVGTEDWNLILKDIYGKYAATLSK